MQRTLLIDPTLGTANKWLQQAAAVEQPNATGRLVYPSVTDRDWPLKMCLCEWGGKGVRDSGPSNAMTTVAGVAWLTMGDGGRLVACEVDRRPAPRSIAGRSVCHPFTDQWEPQPGPRRAISGIILSMVALLSAREIVAAEREWNPLVPGGSLLADHRLPLIADWLEERGKMIPAIRSLLRWPGELAVPGEEPAPPGQGTADEYDGIAEDAGIDANDDSPELDY